MNITAQGLHFQELNRQIREAADSDIRIDGCCGQRYIGSGLGGKRLEIHGTPGNALGAYLDGSTIAVSGNAQDATGDTMNAGSIVIDGNAGDATGYAMRGGTIFVRGNTGYRAGIHMKAYKEQQPVLVVGGEAGSFLGEYQAGGIIIVLGIGSDKNVPVGNFCGTGMHGGRIYIRCPVKPENLPEQVAAAPASAQDIAFISDYIGGFCSAFSLDEAELMKGPFFVLTPNTKNPYRQMYVND